MSKTGRNTSHEELATLRRRVAALEAKLSKAEQERDLLLAQMMDLYLETFDVGTLVKTVAAAVQPLLDKNQNKLIIQRDAELGEIWADMAKVRQILFNLLSNAAKFSHRGTVTLAVSRTDEESAETDKVTFRVSDNGPGISPQELDQLFDGTYPALTTSWYFCHAMGGEMRVESELGVGSTFTLCLPARVVGQHEGAPLLPEIVIPLRPQDILGQESTVLVIDDDPSTQELITQFLNREGFQTVAASSGEEGLRLAREIHPDVITLDVLMREMDGWAILAQIKSSPELMDIPVVILTILDNEQMGFALGASDYLTKPIDRDHLLKTLRRYRKESAAQTLEQAYVLVVEDDDSSRRMLRRMLQLAAWEVSEAADGYIALEKIAERVPALILLDLMMPKMDGFEFINELHKNPAWRTIPIVVITAKDLSKAERKRLKGTVEQILQKGDYRRDDLLREVRDQIFTHVRYREPRSGE